MYFLAWSAWSPGACTVTCNNGTASQTRSCTDHLSNVVADVNCGPENSSESFSCVTGIACPGLSKFIIIIEHHFTSTRIALVEWSTWSIGSCSVTCSDGAAVQTRTCVDHLSANVADLNCGSGSSSENVPCLTGIVCPGL